MFGVVAVAVAPLGSRLHADDAEPTTTAIAFSKADAPRTLRIETARGDISVVGADVDNVTVQTSAAPIGDVPRRADGLRVIAASNSFSLTERDNVVSLSQNSGGFGQRRNDFKTGPADDARRAGAPATLATGGYGSGPAWAGRCSGASVANISRSSALTTFPPLLTGSSASLIQRVGTL